MGGKFKFSAQDLEYFFGELEFFLVSSEQFGSNFWVQMGCVGPQHPKMGFNRVELTSKRVQIWIQPLNVLNRPDLNPTRFWAGLGPQGPISSRVGLLLRLSQLYLLFAYPNCKCARGPCVQFGKHREIIIREFPMIQNQKVSLIEQARRLAFMGKSYVLLIVAKSEQFSMLSTVQ